MAKISVGITELTVTTIPSGSVVFHAEPWLGPASVSVEWSEGRTARGWHRRPRAMLLSVSSPARVVYTRPRLSKSNVGADVGVTTRFPPCEPRVSPRLPATDVHDEEREPQREAQPERERNRSPDLHLDRLLSRTRIQGCKLWSGEASSSYRTAGPLREWTRLTTG